MYKMNLIAKNQQETENKAKNLAKSIKNGDILCLHGDLGMGKTVFAREFIRTLTNNPEMEVPSPTFTLVQTYNSDKGAIYHFDCYRLEDAEEIFELGWEEAMSEGIVIIEWPSRIQPLLPTRRLDITLAPVENELDHRNITLKWST